MTNIPRILVTGARGFLGSHIVTAGRSSGYVMLPACRSAPSSGVFRVDVCDPLSVDEAFRHLLPTIVIHCASYGVNYADQSVECAMKVNIDGSLRVLTSAAKYGTKRFVHVGSCFEYGNQSGLIPEDAPLNPTALYGATKAAATLLVRERARALGLDLMVLRPFGMWGPRERPYRLIPQVLEACLEGRPLKLTACEVLRDYSYVEDMAQWILALATLPEVEQGMVVNVGTGHGVLLRDFVLSIARLLGGEELMKFGELPYRPTEMISLVADNRLFNSLIGTRRSTALIDGVKRMAVSMNARQEFGRTNRSTTL